MNRSKQVMTVFMAAFISVFMVACKTKIVITDNQPNRAQRTIEVEIDTTPVPDGEGGTKSNEENKEENGDKGASFMFIHTGGSNVNLASGEIPQLILTLTKSNIPAYSKVFPGIINNDMIFFANPTEVDIWAEPYLALTDGIKLETNLTMERIPGLNTIVLKAYHDGTFIDATTTGEWVTDLDPESGEFGGGE